jgi:ATP-dependent DNA helicase 2 subunit 1
LGDGGRVIFKKTSDMTTEDKARMRYFYEDKEKKKGADVQRFRVPMGSLAELAAHRTKNNDNAKFASLKFFGFRPIEDFSVLDSCGPAYMIHPTDEIVAGSKDAFLHLHASMLRKKVMAIGEKVLRVSWSSKLVAVVPMDDTETPVMMVVDLPFEDDVRVLEPDYSMQEQALATVKDEMSEKVEEDPYSNHLIGSIGSAQLVEAAKTLIDYQKFPEEMNVEDEFENTALQKFYNYLESVALEMPAKDVHDPYANISLPEGVEEEIQRFASFLPEDVKPLKVKTESKKRKNVQEDTSGIDWHDRFETGTIGKCKNGELQSFLRSIGEKTGGNKSVLVERVESYLAANPVKRVKVED